MVDRVADHDGTPLPHEVLVWFPTAQNSLYQLRQWYAALRALDVAHRVVCVFRDSRTAALVRDESGLDCVTVASSGELDTLLTGGSVRLALYVNLDPLDFECLRFRQLAHVYIGHGDSDKGVFASNQVKAFDRYLVAGRAAVERLHDQLMFFDAEAHCLVVGQPQADALRLAPGPLVRTRPVVAYAPTWEGAEPSVSYSSLISHGQALLTSLLDADDLDVIYRPHPLTGALDPAFGAADATLRELVTTAGHRVDLSPTLAPTLSSASILVTDVSAVTSFWLPTGRPVLVTRPTSGATVSPRSLSAALPTLDASEASRAAAVVSALLADPPPLTTTIEYHLGDTTPGAATEAFVRACSRLLGERDTAWGALPVHDDI